MPGGVSFNGFSPSTVIKSSEVNANFVTIKTILEGLRPTIFFYVPSVLLASTNVSLEAKIRTGNTLYFSKVDMSCKTAPTGAAIIVDINKNGSTIFSTRPQIAASATTGGTAAVFSTTSVTEGDVLTIDLDQVGSTEPGRDLSIALSMLI